MVEWKSTPQIMQYEVTLRHVYDSIPHPDAAVAAAVLDLRSDGYRTRKGLDTIPIQSSNACACVLSR